MKNMLSQLLRRRTTSSVLRTSSITTSHYSTTTPYLRNITEEGVPLGTAAVPSGTQLPLPEDTEKTILQREVSSSYKTYDSVPYHMRRPIQINEHGRSILEEGLFNKGTSFGIGERDRLGMCFLLLLRRLFFFFSLLFSFLHAFVKGDVFSKTVSKRGSNLLSSSFFF